MVQRGCQRCVKGIGRMGARLQVRPRVWRRHQKSSKCIASRALHDPFGHAPPTTARRSLSCLLLPPAKDKRIQRPISFPPTRLTCKSSIFCFLRIRVILAWCRFLSRDLMRRSSAVMRCLFRCPLPPLPPLCVLAMDSSRSGSNWPEECVRGSPSLCGS